LVFEDVTLYFVSEIDFVFIFQLR